MVKIALTKYLPESIDIYEDHLNISVNKAIITKKLVAHCAVINSHSLKTHYCWHYRMLSGARRYVTWHDPDNAILLNTILWTHTHIALQVAPLPKLHQKTIAAIYCGKEDGQDKTLPRKSQNQNWRSRISSPPPFSSILVFFSVKYRRVLRFESRSAIFNPPKCIPTKIGAYSDSTMIDHRCLLNLIGASIFHHFTTGGIGNDTRRSISLNWSMNLFFTNHQFPNNCAHCNVSRWCH